jgi:hypothetical protein
LVFSKISARHRKAASQGVTAGDERAANHVPVFRIR